MQAALRQLDKGSVEALSKEAERVMRGAVPVLSGRLLGSIRRIPGAAGKPTRVATTAGHSHTIDKGRRVGPHSRKSGGQRLMGSDQAPQGFSGPTEAAVVERAESLLRPVIQDSESRL